MLHGRMLLAGAEDGAEGLDILGALCVAWAFLDERYSATGETLNPTGSDELKALLTGQDDDLDDLEQLRAEMGLPELTERPLSPTPPPSPMEPLDELRALREAMRPPEIDSAPE